MQATYPETVPVAPVPRAPIVATHPIKVAFRALHVWFVIMPLVAGIDKFTMILVDWHRYLAPAFGFAGHTFMYVVGVVEIAAGILTAVKPRFGGLIVAAWLVLIAINLWLHPAGYLDIAVRDIGLAIGAFALSRLAAGFAR